MHSAIIHTTHCVGTDTNLGIKTCLFWSLELLCGLLKETSAGLEQRLGGGKAAREWERMFTKARYTCIYMYRDVHVYIKLEFTCLSGL